MSAYAVIGPGGTVENRIEIEPDIVASFAERIGKTLVDDEAGNAIIGGTWDGQAFAPPS